MEGWADKLRPLQEQCQNIYPYNLRVGPLPSNKTTVVSLCDCPQVCVTVLRGAYWLYIPNHVAIVTAGGREGVQDTG